MGFALEVSAASDYNLTQLCLRVVDLAETSGSATPQCGKPLHNFPSKIQRRDLNGRARESEFEQ